MSPPSSMTSQPEPLRKRRRTCRACDECRRKKIKCDGKQPCTHCTVHSYECTYDHPSSRRHNTTPQYVEALETRLQKAEILLRAALPDVNLDGPQLDLHTTEQKIAAHMEEDGLLDAKVDSSGLLDRDDRGHWDYHESTSCPMFVRRLRKQLGAMEVPGPMSQAKIMITKMLESPNSTSESLQDTVPPLTHYLPSRATARRLCNNALDDACSLMRFVHEPSFLANFDRIYDTPQEQFGNEETEFLPLLYIVMAVGCLFSDDEAGNLDFAGNESAIMKGFQFFEAGRQLLAVTDCRNLTSLQTICFMVVFLQSSAKLSTCYSYVGIALRSALRLGLHRSVDANFNPVERELRKRIFWVIRNMDIYVNTFLGLPQMLSDDDIDQEYPLAVDDEFISPQGIFPMPSGYTSLMAGCNAHTRLSNITLKVVKYIYPLKNARHHSKFNRRYLVSHSKIREIERDLQAWMEELPAALRPGTEVSPQLERVRQQLRISYAHVQMVMYRPFLHYATRESQIRGVDKRSYACAAACVSVSRNIVYITASMQKRGLLNGSFWFTIYSTYFAILSLIFFVAENPGSPATKDGILKDAMEGRNTLDRLAKKSMAADRCSQSLTVCVLLSGQPRNTDRKLQCLFQTLPEILKNRQSAKTRVNFTYPALPHSPTAAKIPSPQSLSHHSSSFPFQRVPQAGLGEAPSHQKPSLDDTQSNHSHESDTQSALMAGISELPIETISLLDNIQTTCPQNLSKSIKEASNPVFFQQFNNPTNLPDLMFSLDDPFAYPTQNMEDGHFRSDQSGTSSSQDLFDHTGMASTTSTNPPSMRVTAPSFGAFHNLPQSAAAKSSVPSRLSSATQSMSEYPSQSPMLQTSLSGNEALGSPDLVSIPSQNFVWQGYYFQPSIGGLEQTAQQGSSAGDQVQDSNMGTDQDTLGPYMALNIPFDDLFNNFASGDGAFNEERMQWMNRGA
ncbi:hypothetical protein N7510_004080 [Penicillium lagena]|uniref:uncharacterized protein n=1 Tax=Penicillium lagena TaxID=94218 RepID=UPI0025412240|nr:uncharacterized protein N7510_004080 [Penicillium lagena]KAJ5620096.1 hypothetical protein N7510_004080 [Penicillium lagena]